MGIMTLPVLGFDPMPLSKKQHVFFFFFPLENSKQDRISNSTFGYFWLVVGCLDETLHGNEAKLHRAAAGLPVVFGGLKSKS